MWLDGDNKSQQDASEDMYRWSTDETALSWPQAPRNTPPAKAPPRDWAAINTTPVWLSAANFPQAIGVGRARTSWHGRKAAEDGGECDHGVEVATRGGGRCVDEEGQEGRVEHADVSKKHGGARVHERYAKLARDVNHTGGGETLDKLRARLVSCPV